MYIALIQPERDGGGASSKGATWLVRAAARRGGGVRALELD